ncbi:winged helix-turn-helix domain-containing protein [Luteimonas sp. gir]|jgi:DNA-binding winged helix-turn-helix (wHTH) protein|uniref:winged helix-turn-helix domain-containing protein n=1 Tax=Luteimonas sp. gir TaxID=3127960 RepID=UPI003075B322
MASKIPGDSGRFRIGDWIVVPAEGRLLRAGHRRRLEPRTMTLLCALAASNGAVRSADALLDACWPGQDLGDNAVHKHVALLRAALGDSAQAPRYIDTLHRRGYRLLVPVAPVIAHGGVASAEADAAALVAGACALDDVLDPAPRMRDAGVDALVLARLARDNRRLRTLCAALLRRCRGAEHGPPVG